jgi:ribose 5-phosphate isomerase B
MPNDETIAIASDHAGFELKTALCEHLQAGAVELIDLGVHSADAVDYPDIGFALARLVRDGRAGRGVLICGSGIGVSIAANRYPEIRAALVHDETSARLARQHNDANVICFGARTIGAEAARQCLRIFLDPPFDGGRHALRVDKLRQPS